MEVAGDCPEMSPQNNKSVKNANPFLKYFATLELLEQVKDRTWLAKITNALSQHWQKKNAARSECPSAVLPRLPETV